MTKKPNNKENKYGANEPLIIKLKQLIVQFTIYKIVCTQKSLHSKKICQASQAKMMN
jgi:hypothetical protein